MVMQKILLSLLIILIISPTFVFAFSTAKDPDPFDFNYWRMERNNSVTTIVKISNNSTAAVTWPVLLNEVPNPTPAYHGENYSNYIAPKNNSENKSALDRIMDNPIYKYLFLIFIIAIVCIGLYVFYKYSQEGETISFDKDFGF